MAEPKKRKGPGQPPKDPAEKRSVRRLVLMTEGEHKQLLNSTGKLEMSQSGFMRAAAMLTLDKIQRGEVDLVEFLGVADS